jgi:hypothetical protein
MPLGPIEVLVIGFPGNQFNGRIVPEIQGLIDREIIAVVDGLLISKDADGDVTVIEFEESGIDQNLAALGELCADAVADLISSEDVDEFAAALDPNSSAAVLVFEHTWAKPFRDAIVDSGGVLVNNIRIPGPVVEEVLAAVASLD